METQNVLATAWRSPSLTQSKPAASAPLERATFRAKRNLPCAEALRYRALRAQRRVAHETRATCIRAQPKAAAEDLSSGAQEGDLLLIEPRGKRGFAPIQ